jgi:hypothetical protein
MYQRFSKQRLTNVCSGQLFPKNEFLPGPTKASETAVTTIGKPDTENHPKCITGAHSKQRWQQEGKLIHKTARNVSLAWAQVSKKTRTTEAVALLWLLCSCSRVLCNKTKLIKIKMNSVKIP